MQLSADAWRFYAVDRYDEFARVWDDLNAASSGPPFLRSLFIRNLLKVFGTGAERIVALGPRGEERALGIIGPRRASTWTTFQPSQLPLGAWVMQSSLDYTDVADSLLRALPGLPLLLSLTQQDPIVRPRPAESATLRTVDYIETGWVDVAGAFDAYWKARGKRLQQNMRTQRSRLRNQGIETTLEVLTRPEQVRGAIADYGRLESAGWKGAEGTAVREDDAQGRFYRSMLEDFCRADAARIYRYRFGNRVVAVDLCIESPQVQVPLKTTYDESIQGLSPSSLLRQEAYRHVFEEGRVGRIEFYGRMVDWTSRWTELSRTLYHVNAYRWGMVARLRSAMRRGEYRMRPHVRPSGAVE